MSIQNLLQIIHLAIAEDCPQTDITCTSLNLSNTSVDAKLITKEDGVFFGQDITTSICKEIDPSLALSFHTKDGETIKKMQTLLTIEGPSLSLLRAERLVLNFLQRLCGIATTTRQYVQALNNPSIAILDTRKTTPGLRLLEKQAVIAGGGKNHRMNLSDMMLIKENHLKTLQNEGRFDQLETLLTTHKKNHPTIPIEIEVETLDELKTLPLHLANYVMFDNFSIENVQIGADILKAQNISAEIEISGGITLDTIHLYQNLPIHRISIGALTHSVKALDLSLLEQ